MTKRIIICSDGTWNTPDQKSGGKYRPSNVVKTARAIAATSAADGKSQIVFYDQGVGTGNLLDRISGGAFGSGLEKNIEDEYRFLMHNFDDGDEIYLFGFSRGAYTVRSLAGLIYNSGLLRKIHADKFPEACRLYRNNDVHPDSVDAKQFRASYSREVKIWFIGVWDTVGALGIPVRGLRFLTKGRYEFHDPKLNEDVKHAYHALGIDERRGPFEPTFWIGDEKEGQVVEQVWFAGVHSDIGGGYQEHGLSDVAFMWMKEKANECGLAFDEGYVSEVVHPKPAGILHNSMTGFYRLTRGITRNLNPDTGTNIALHLAAVERHEVDPPRYAPENLVEYVKNQEQTVTEVQEG